MRIILTVYYCNFTFHKMKKKVFIVLLCIACVSCKKKEDELTNEPVPEAEIPVGPTSGYDALFSNIKTYSKTGGAYVLSGEQNTGYYSGKTIGNEIYNAADLQNIGGVVLNNIVLKTKSTFADHYYNDTTHSAFTPPYNWQVLGSSVVDSFSFANPNPLPEFPLAVRIPDSVNISAGLTIRLKGTSGCDLIRVLLMAAGQSINKLTAGTDTLIMISPADMASLGTTNTGYLSVQLYKDNYRKINGKKVNFRTGVAYANTAFKVKE